MTLLRHVTVVKRVSNSEIYPGTELVADMKLQFPGLYAHLILNPLDFYSLGMFEGQV
jgi:hypothetical protein